MPRYRLLKPLPAVLVYRDGTRLLLERFASGGIETLHARKDQRVPHSAVILVQGTGGQLDTILATGFDLTPNHPGAIAADKILQTLVAKGYAERLP